MIWFPTYVLVSVLSGELSRFGTIRTFKMFFVLCIFCYELCVFKYMLISFSVLKQRSEEEVQKEKRSVIV